MPSKSLAVSVDLTLYSVSCPGVVLKDREEIFVEICVFGLHKQSLCVPAIFPLYFNERFKFRKVFYNCVNPLELHEALSNETVTIEVVQKSKFIHAGVVLASIELTAKDFLFPYPSAVPVYSGADRELLLNKTLHFNGISPKLEFSSVTCVNEVHTTATDELHDKIQEINREGTKSGSEERNSGKTKPDDSNEPPRSSGESQSGGGVYNVSIETSIQIDNPGQSNSNAKNFNHLQTSPKSLPAKPKLKSRHPPLKSAKMKSRVPPTQAKPFGSKPNPKIQGITKSQSSNTSKRSLGIQTEAEEIFVIDKEERDLEKPKICSRSTFTKEDTKQIPSHRDLCISPISCMGDNNYRETSDVYSSARNRFFQMVHNRKQTSECSSFSSRDGFDRIQNLSLLHCFEEAYMAKCRRSSLNNRTADESWEKLSVVSLKSLDLPDRSIHAEVSNDIDENFTEQGDARLEQVFIDICPKSPASFTEEVSHLVLRNYPLSAAELNWHENLETLEKHESTNASDIPPDFVSTGNLDDLSMRAMRSPGSNASEGAGDRPKSKPNKTEVITGGDSKQNGPENSELANKLREILTDQDHFELKGVKHKTGADNFGKSRVRSVNKIFKGHFGKNSKKKSRLVVTERGFAPVDANCVKVFKISSGKRENSKYKIIKHFRSASPTRGLSRSRSMSSLKINGLSQKPPFVVRKVDEDLLKNAEPMTATEQLVRTGRSKKRKSKKRPKSVTGSRSALGKTYMVEKHYGTGSSAYANEYSNEEAEDEYNQADGMKVVAFSDDEQVDEYELDDYGTKEVKPYRPYSSAPLRKTIDDIRAERYLRYPIPPYSSAYSELILERLERKRMLEELEREARLARLHSPYVSGSDKYREKYEQELYWARKRRDLERSLDHLYDRLYRL